MRWVSLLLLLFSTAQTAFALADCPQQPRVFAAPLEKNLDETIDDELGTIRLQVSAAHSGKHPWRMDLTVQCKGRLEPEVIIENELLCDFRTSSWDPCTKELVLRYSLATKSCSVHNRQVFDLRAQCAGP